MGKKMAGTNEFTFFRCKSICTGGGSRIRLKKFGQCLPAGTGTKIYFPSRRLFVTCGVFARYFFAAFSWLFCGPLLSRKTVFGPFSWLFRGFFVASVLGRIYAHSPWNSLLKDRKVRALSLIFLSLLFGFPCFFFRKFPRFF